MAPVPYDEFAHITKVEALMPLVKGAKASAEIISSSLSMGSIKRKRGSVTADFHLIMTINDHVWVDQALQDHTLPETKAEVGIILSGLMREKPDYYGTWYEPIGAVTGI